MNDATVDSSPPPLAPAPSTETGDHARTPVPNNVPPKLLVLRGCKIGAEYPIYEGRNTIGRFADKPVDIDLVLQESVEQIWCSRQHAVITLSGGIMVIEDMNSLNGTWVNGARIQAGQKRELNPGDIIQIGTVQLKLTVV
jgi:pSer/pThr/pTyr-binding forkhead associated (FHA) protein